MRPMLVRDPFLLKFAFFGFGDGKRALELIDEQIESYEEQLRRRDKNLRAVGRRACMCVSYRNWGYPE